MATDWKYHGQNEYGIDAPCRITGATAQVGALTCSSTIAASGVVSATGLTVTAGPVIRNIAVLGSAGTITAATDIALYTSSADSSIAAPAVIVNGRSIIIKNVGTGTCTFDPDGIDGGASQALTPNEYIEVVRYTAGTTWYIVSDNL